MGLFSGSSVSITPYILWESYFLLINFDPPLLARNRNWGQLGKGKTGYYSSSSAAALAADTHWEGILGN